MDELIRWQQENNRFLAAALAWLRLRLAWQAEQMEPSPPLPQAVTEAEVAQAASALAAAESTEPPPALVMLSQRFGLSPFEQQVRHDRFFAPFVKMNNGRANSRIVPGVGAGYGIHRIGSQKGLFGRGSRGSQNLFFNRPRTYGLGMIDIPNIAPRILTEGT